MHKLIQRLCRPALAVLALALFPWPVLGQAGGRYELTWSTVDGGGETRSSGGRYELGGTVGQPDAGRSAGGRYELSGGFWSGGRLVVLPAMFWWATLVLVLLLLAAGRRASDPSGREERERTRALNDA